MPILADQHLGSLYMATLKEFLFRHNNLEVRPQNFSIKRLLNRIDELPSWLRLNICPRVRLDENWMGNLLLKIHLCFVQLELIIIMQLSLPWVSRFRQLCLEQHTCTMGIFDPSSFEEKGYWSIQQFSVEQGTYV